MDTTRAYEEAYLNTVLEKLRQRIRTLEDKTRVGQQNLSDAGFKLWDEITHVIRDFDDVAALTDARNEFNSLIGQINQVLQFIVTGRMDDPSGCTGDCGSCGGCH